MDGFSRHKLNKKAVVLNDTLDKLALIEAYRTFHPKKAKYTFFKSTCNILQDRLHVRPWNSLNKFKMIETTSSCFFFFNHNSIRLEIKYGKAHGESTNTWIINNMLLTKKSGSMKKKRRNHKIYWDKLKWIHNFLKCMERAKAVLRSLQKYRPTPRNMKNLK